MAPKLTVPKDVWPLLVISTKAEGRAEKSGREWALRQIRNQMSRLRCAPLDMTDGDKFPPHRGEARVEPRTLNGHFSLCGWSGLRPAYLFGVGFW
jgi:hypothetical protein